MSYLILAQSEVTARALGAWLELLGEEPLRTEDDRLGDERVLFARDPFGFPGGFVPCFHRLAGVLREAVRDRPAGGTIVLVDAVKPSDFNAVGAPNGWNRLISLLILAFPEVRWVFGVSSGKKKPLWWEARHGLPSLFGPIFDPLFDGTGLRAHVREQTVEAEATSDDKIAPWIPLRQEWAAAIDDETMYAYLHAYIAYRHGFRAFAIHTEALADHMLKDNDEKTRASLDQWNLDSPYLTLEDYYLGFPDKASARHYASLENREHVWDKLKDKNTLRHFITSGHGRGQGQCTVFANREFRSRLRAEGRGGKQVSKPIPGIFALWQELRLDRTLFHRDGKGRAYRGLAPGFDWPPNERASAQDRENGGGHSAPGLLLLVAEHLVERAETLLESVRTVKDAVRGAVLAISALELLGPKAPTTARDALELKHRFEALAECQFGGVQYNLQLDDRFAEIRRDMRMLGRWYGVHARDAARISGELTIISRLMAIYAEYEEFDEAEICRQRIRTLHRRIWWRQHRANPVAWLVWPIRAYIEFLLGSLTRFTTALFLWIAGLTLAFMTVKGPAEQAGEPASFSPFSQAVSFFFGVEPLNSTHFGWIALTLLTTLSGFVHLGVFISQVYATLTRR